MKFTFGITTTKEPQRMSRNTNNHIREMIDAIRVNEIPEDSYEIIIVGGDNKYQHLETGWLGMTQIYVMILMDTHIE